MFLDILLYSSWSFSPAAWHWLIYWQKGVKKWKKHQRNNCIRTSTIRMPVCKSPAEKDGIICQCECSFDSSRRWRIWKLLLICEAEHWQAYQCFIKLWRQDSYRSSSAVKLTSNTHTHAHTRLTQPKMHGHWCLDLSQCELNVDNNNNNKKHRSIQHPAKSHPTNSLRGESNDCF